ncbi:MAG: phosphoribosylamine--glycine ligase family protein, partial [Cyclobacteriaceae bacterium]
MNILVVGSGGREHALAWKIKQSKKCGQLFVAPGNAGTSSVARNVAIGVEDFESLGKFSLEKNIDLIVVGPEGPLVKGIRDYFEAN